MIITSARGIQLCKAVIRQQRVITNPQIMKIFIRKPPSQKVANQSLLGFLARLTVVTAHNPLEGALNVLVSCFNRVSPEKLPPSVQKIRSSRSFQGMTAYLDAEPISKSKKK